MEDLDELLGDLRVVCKYFIDSEIEGYTPQIKDAVYMAELFKQLDTILCEEEDLPYDWTNE